MGSRRAILYAQSGRTRTGIHSSGRDGDGSIADRIPERGAIVLYFYPADFTPGCTRQACVLRDLQTDIQQKPAARGRHQPAKPGIACQIRAKYNLPFTLLSDQHKAVIKMYGVNGPAGHRRAPRLLPDRRQPPHPRCGAGGFHDRPPRRFRAQGLGHGPRQESADQDHSGVGAVFHDKDSRHRAGRRRSIPDRHICRHSDLRPQPAPSLEDYRARFA
jgi:peroxiredoxin